MVWTVVEQFSGNIVYDFNEAYNYRINNLSSQERSVTFLGDTYTMQPNTAKVFYYVPTGSFTIASLNSGVLNLERELKNTAPTQPGAFTQPTGELEIGDTRTISWGASADAEGNLSGYVIERSINGGAYTVYDLAGSGPAWADVIPTATTLKYRVKAKDSAGLESPYRESPTYTVTKPKYYWSKYNVVRKNNFSIVDSASNQTRFIANGSRLWSAYNADLNNGTISGTGSSAGTSGAAVPPVVGYYYIDAAKNEIWKVISSVYVDDSYGFNSQVQVFTLVNNPYDAMGTLIQSGLIAVEGTYPTDGKHTDGFWYVRGSRVNQSIAPAGAFTAPTPATVLKPGQGVAVTFTASTAANISLYELEYRYNSGLWTTLGTNNTALTRSFTPTTDKTLTNVQFRVRAKNTSNVYSDYVYSEFYNIEHNAKPTITLTTGNNLALSENANLAIGGQAVDADNGNVLTVYYQINTGNTTALATGISNGTAPLPYTKTLQFKQGALYDGTTIVFNNMVGDQTYTLKVWAEDNQGGKSDVQSRLFTVIPNRAPILTVTAIESASNKINNDTMTIAGTVTDPENQTITVKYKINNGELIQVYSGAGGNYTFNFKLGALNVGDNIIEIQAADSYNLITTVKKRITKRADMVNLLTSVARYKGTLPTAGVTGVVAWFERETGDLTINPTVSMRTAGQTESYEDMTLSNTAPINAEITEDQYQKSVETAKTELVLKVSLEKTVAASTKGIKKITGALQ